MPRKKKQTEEVVTEKVEGRVEGMTFTEEEQRIRREARERALAEHDEKVYGTTKMSAVIGSILKNRARNGGIRERVFSCGAELAGYIDAYFHVVFTALESGSNEIPDTEALADFLGITRATLIRWGRGEENREFAAPIQLAMNEIAMSKKQLALDNKVNGLVYLSDMQNNHEYVSNQKSADVHLNIKMQKELPPIEQLNAQMALLDAK